MLAKLKSMNDLDTDLFQYAKLLAEQRLAEAYTVFHRHRVKALPATQEMSGWQGMGAMGGE